MIHKVLRFVRHQLEDAHSAPSSEYNKGFVTSLEDVEEFITDLMWEEGVDEED